MGQEIGRSPNGDGNIMLMYANHTNSEIKYLIIIDEVTGERVTITFSPPSFLGRIKEFLATFQYYKFAGSPKKPFKRFINTVKTSYKLSYGRK